MIETNAMDPTARRLDGIHRGVCLDHVYYYNTCKLQTLSEGVPRLSLRYRKYVAYRIECQFQKCLRERCT